MEDKKINFNSQSYALKSKVISILNVGSSDYNNAMGNLSKSKQHKKKPKLKIIIGGTAVVGLAAWLFCDYKNPFSIESELKKNITASFLGLFSAVGAGYAGIPLANRIFKGGFIKSLEKENNILNAEFLHQVLFDSSKKKENDKENDKENNKEVFEVSFETQWRKKEEEEQKKKEEYKNSTIFQKICAMVKSLYDYLEYTDKYVNHLYKEKKTETLYNFLAADDGGKTAKLELFFKKYTESQEKNKSEELKKLIDFLTVVEKNNKEVEKNNKDFKLEMYKDFLGELVAQYIHEIHAHILKNKKANGGYDISCLFSNVKLIEWYKKNLDICLKGFDESDIAEIKIPEEDTRVIEALSDFMRFLVKDETENKYLEKERIFDILKKKMSDELLEKIFIQEFNIEKDVGQIRNLDFQYYCDECNDMQKTSDKITTLCESAIQNISLEEFKKKEEQEKKDEKEEKRKLIECLNNFLNIVDIKKVNWWCLIVDKNQAVSNDQFAALGELLAELKKAQEKEEKAQKKEEKEEE